MSARLWFPLSLLAAVALTAALLLPASSLARGKVPPPESLARQTPQTTALIELRKRQAKQKKKPFHVRRTWVRLADISPELKETVLAAEDGRFYYHRGVEWELVKKAFQENMKAGRSVRGASTITQQLAKNLYLSPRKSYLRKAQELLFTWRLERSLTKNRIFELYLNAAEWGDGIFGVEAAAQTYFGVPAADLGEEEAIALAAVLPSPRRHSPVDSTRWTAVRKEWVRRQLELQRRPRDR